METSVAVTASSEEDTDDAAALAAETSYIAREPCEAVERELVDVEQLAWEDEDLQTSVSWHPLSNESSHKLLVKRASSRGVRAIMHVVEPNVRALPPTRVGD